WPLPLEKWKIEGVVFRRAECSKTFSTIQTGDDEMPIFSKRILGRYCLALPFFAAILVGATGCYYEAAYYTHGSGGYAEGPAFDGQPEYWRGGYHYVLCPECGEYYIHGTAHHHHYRYGHERRDHDYYDERRVEDSSEHHERLPGSEGEARPIPRRPASP